MAEFTYIHLLIFLALAIAANTYASLALDKWMQYRMIFGWWRLGTARFLLGKKELEIGIKKDTEAYFNEITGKALEQSMLYKMLGGCIVCFPVWLSIPVYMIGLMLWRQLFTIGFVPVDFYILEYWHIALWIFYTTASNYFIRRYDLN